MAFSYAAGTSTPGLAGLAEISGIRINQEPGTFVLTRCGRLVESPQIRSGVVPLPSDHGGYLGTSLYSPMPFSLEGYLTVPVLADIWGAIDLLNESFNLDNGAQTLVLNTSGWSATRQISVILDGPIQIVEPTMLAKNLPDRDFVIPLIAADPRLYATSLTTTAVTTATAVTNAGTVSTPFTVRFTGPLTNPKIDGPGTAGTNRIKYNDVIASGDWVEVSTDASGGITAVDNTGANVYAALTAFTARKLAPGASSWTGSADAGAGTYEIKFRSAWL